MKRRTASKALLAALIAGLLAALGVVLANLGSTKTRRHPHYQRVSVAVGSRPMGQPLAPGFVGPSLEYPAVREYTGPSPRAVDPVMVALIRNLSPGQSVILRIGGHSSDLTWWPEPGKRPPPGINYVLTTDWLQTTRALAVALDAKMIMGVNLAADRPDVAAAEAKAFVRGIGTRYIEALEIGNEPDVYSEFPWYVGDSGHVAFARPHDYSLGDYVHQFTRWREALGDLAPVAGPALAEANWLSDLGGFIAAEPGLTLVTVHHYPLRACLTDPNAPGYPTIPSLLSDRASSGMARQFAPYVAIAHANGVAFRLDEMNSASCGGKRGVSNTFASALWVLDTLFSLASVGMDGVNVHAFSGAAYASFRVKHTPRGWEAFVYPEYYGMLMFARAFPAGARLLPVSVSPRGPLKAWATEGPGPTTRVVLINKNPKRTYQVEVRGQGLSGPIRVERLLAPSAWSTGGVTLGGRTFGRETTTGRLRRLRTVMVSRGKGVYSITVPAASAALLTS